MGRVPREPCVLSAQQSSSRQFLQCAVKESHLPPVTYPFLETRYREKEGVRGLPVAGQSGHASRRTIFKGRSSCNCRQEGSIHPSLPIVTGLGDFPPWVDVTSDCQFVLELKTQSCGVVFYDLPPLPVTLIRPIPSHPLIALGAHNWHMSGPLTRQAVVIPTLPY